MAKPDRPLGLSSLTRIFLTPPPTGIAATGVSQSSVQLTWNALALAESYRVYRGASLIATPTTASYLDTGLAAATGYSYTISSVGFGGEGPRSSIVVGTTLLDSIAPTAPVIAVNALSASQVSVQLTTPSVDTGSGVASYRIEYKRTVDSSWLLATAATTAFPYTIGGLTASTAYDVRARATDVAGNVGPYSNTASATTNLAAVVTVSAKGTNIGEAYYWSWGDAWINKVRAATDFNVSSGSTLDPATGAATLIPGGSVFIPVYRRPPKSDFNHSAIKPGTYTFTWTGGGTSTPILSGGVTRPSYGPGQDTYSVPSESLQDNLIVYMRIVNDTAANITVTNYAFVHADYQALHNAGELFNPDFLARFNSTLGAIRPVQFGDSWQYLLDGASSELSYAQGAWPDTHQFAAARSYVNQARLALKMNVGTLWLNLPIHWTRAAYASLANALNATGYTGKYVLEVGLEFWNYAFPFGLSRSFATNVIVSTIAPYVVDAAGNPSSGQNDGQMCAYAEKSMQAWEEFETVFGASRLIKPLIGQAAFYDITTPSYAYRRNGAGLRSGELCTHLSIAAYVGQTAAIDNTSAFLSAGAASWSQSQWETFMRDALAFESSRVLSWKASRATNPWVATKPTIAYEGSHHVSLYRVQAPQLTYATTTGSTTLTFSSAIGSAFATGHALYTTSLPYGALPTEGGTPINERSAWARVTGTSTATLHPTQTDATNGTNAIVMPVTLASGNAVNVTPIHAAYTGFQNWRFSSQGVAWYGDWWTFALQQFPELVMLFNGTAATVQTAEGSWGLAAPGAGIHQPDSVLYAWFKAVPAQLSSSTLSWVSSGADSYDIGWSASSLASGDRNNPALYPNRLSVGSALSWTNNTGSTAYVAVRSVVGVEVGPWSAERTLLP
jgi:hypothetical protein